jgi:hypothetical protein
MPGEIEGRRLVLCSEIAATRSAIRSEVREVRGGLLLGRVAYDALRLASPRFRWISLLPTAFAAVAAWRARR